MSRRASVEAALVVVVVVVALASAACGEACEGAGPVPAGMTPDRARALLPGLVEGIALSTSVDLGSCGDDAEACPPEPVCGVVRRPMRVLVLPAAGSIPRDPDCPGAYAVADLAPLAREDGTSSEAGEWAARLEPGLWLLAVARSGQTCARCGVVGGAMPCFVEVRPGQIAALDLVR